MNIVDVLIILAAISALFRGHQIGLVKQAGSTIGFVAGLMLSVSLGSRVGTVTSDPTSKVFLSALLLVLLSFGLMIVGEYAGSHLKVHIAKQKFINHIDNYIGSVISLATLVLGLWLLTAIVVLLPSNAIQKTIRESAAFGFVDLNFPPASQALAGINHFIDPNDAPLVFSGKEPSPDASLNLPPLTDFQDIIDAKKQSVVRVQGLGCGGLVNGTGFIYEKNRVVTNAHVVAGVKNPKVYDQSGTHNTKVIYFDEKFDVAVLLVENLTGKPLEISSTTLPKGQFGAVIGYPGGGAQTSQVVASLDAVQALGRDIYDQGKIIRNIQILQAHFIPGNSGGPVIDANGRVVGVVFGTSTSYNNIGYALTMSQILPSLQRTAQLTIPVSTGQCSET